MWSAKNICVCCMCTTQDYKKINEIEVNYGPLRVYEILYKTVPPMEHINKQNPEQFPLPEIICLTCYDSLLKAYKFQEQCLTSIQMLFTLWAEHQLETPIESLDKLQTRDEIKMEIEVESPGIENGYEVEKYVYYIKDVQNELPPEKEVDTDVLGEDVDAINSFDASDGEFLVAEKKNPENTSAENNSPENNSPENKISRQNFEKRYYPCADCGKLFHRSNDLKRHKSQVHSLEKSFECNACSYRFATLKALKGHVSQQHENKANGKRKKSRAKRKEVHPDDCKCPSCTRCVKKKSAKQKEKIHPEGFSCPGCTSCLELKKNCDDCGRIFESPHHLKQHSSVHSLEKPHECYICKYRFSAVKFLASHMRKHENENEDTKIKSRKKQIEENTDGFKCSDCPKYFDNKEKWSSHRKIHTTHLCPECGKSFGGTSNFRQHLEVHKNLRKFQCPDCPSRFNCRSGLIKHASAHTNAKPHVCDICSNSFSRSYELLAHKRKHTGERPYKCTQCSMTFARKYTLDRHERTHTGEKRLKCKFCDRAYNEYGDLNKHLRTHIGENTYICEECPMAFKYQAELKQHQSEHYKAARKLLEDSQNQSQVAAIQEKTVNESQQLEATHQTVNESKQLPCSTEAAHAAVAD